MPLQTRQPTIYPIDPLVFMVRDVADVLSLTGTQNLDLFAVRKGTVVVRCWIDVVTAMSAAGTLTLRMHRSDLGTSFAVQSHSAPDAEGLEVGPVTATGADPIAADGFFRAQKTGANTGLVASFMAVLIRPVMNP